VYEYLKSLLFLLLVFFDVLTAATFPSSFSSGTRKPIKQIQMPDSVLLLPSFIPQVEQSPLPLQQHQQSIQLAFIIHVQ